ncbi:hypothetical protein DV706_10000 [Natronorubrum bangense]|uniref:Uncharacterized protein n=2 Tax=Natronorubrum bangense TaxID=61858 RepID=L9WP46_9EURY|nr:hypothetical protein C494_02775 [Natronorubrum bangense JCM 10635]QCC54769.1 hypothetical protein DV706_10000 [Natronorubrum bangense]
MSCRYRDGSFLPFSFFIDRYGEVQQSISEPSLSDNGQRSLNHTVWLVVETTVFEHALRMARTLR